MKPRNISIHIYLFILVVVAVAMVCCGRRGAAWRGMDRAERLMAVSPDSAPAALAVLDSITPGMLGGGEEKARYALLKSMTLDKNYIDTTDFKVLQPAIDYYLTKDKGTADDKLRTYYYQGRIYQNQGDDDAAMQSFMRGRDLGSQVKDTLTLANLMVAQGTIFITTYKYDEFIKVNLDGAKLYHDLGKYDYEVLNLANALDASVITDNKHLADSVMHVSRQRVKEHPDLRKYIDPYILSYTVNFGSNQDIGNLLSYMPLDSIEDDVRIEIANAYCKIGEPHKAAQVLESIPEDSRARNTLKYKATKPYVLDQIGDIPGAFAAYQDYANTTDSIHRNIFAHDLLFAQQRHELEKENLIKLQRRNMMMMGIACMALVALIAAIFVYHRYKLGKAKIRLAEQEKKRLMLEQEALRAEVDALNEEIASFREVLEKQEEPSSPVAELIKDRIKMLKSIVASQITGDGSHIKPYEEWIESLARDRSKFIENTRKALSASHPSFIKHFKNLDLTENEINYVCLYALGLKAKEVGNFMKTKSHYQVNSEIRRKLGLGGRETNLDIHIRKLMKEL